MNGNMGSVRVPTTVYISSALKTAVPVVLEACRREGGLDPAARPELGCGCASASETGPAPSPSLLTARPLKPGPWRGPPSPGGRALRPAAALAPRLPSLWPSAFQLAPVLAFP